MDRAKGMANHHAIEITGLDSMVVLRKGHEDQEIGTTVEITSREKLHLFDAFGDHVQLLEVLRMYALTCEFTIEAHRAIAGITGQLLITPGITEQKTPMERISIQQYETFEQPFSAIHTDMRGTLRTSILVDDSHRPSLSNSEASWQPDEKDGYALYRGDSKVLSRGYSSEGVTCLDGILVCGIDHLDPDFNMPLNVARYPNFINTGMDVPILDIRGALKPPLTPARTLPLSRGITDSRGPRWERIQSLVEDGRGKLWEQIIDRMGGEHLNQETFWQLATIYGMKATYLSAGRLWQWLSVPLCRLDGSFMKWRRISEFDAIDIVQSSESSFALQVLGEQLFLEAHENLTRWEVENRRSEVSWRVKDLAAAFSIIEIISGRPCLRIKEPNHPDEVPSQFYWRLG